jgi:Dolichyl-phosphate-mannose-protein mannosyltransferase
LAKKYMQAAGCAGVLLVAALLTKPFAEIGICDDWSYIWSARVMAETGRIAYNGWGAMMLGWQLYLGGLAIRLFGFSFAAPRLTILLVAMICTVVMHRVFVRLGASESMASLATLSIVLSPLFLPLSVNFMTDVPCLLVIAVCLYCCVRAIQADSNRSANLWVIAAYASNVAGGTVRQVAWLGALVMVPSVVVYLRRRVMHVGIAGWVVSAAIIAYCIHWFNTQNYSVIEPVFYRYHGYSLLYVGCSLLTIGVCLIPMLLPFLSKVPVAAAIGAVFGALIFWFSITTKQNYFSVLNHIPFGNEQGYLTAKGMGVDSLLSSPPVVLNLVTRFILTILATASGAAFLAKIKSVDRELFYLCAPFTTAYFFLVGTRVHVYDRYYLPVIFVATILIVRSFQTLPRICIAAVTLYALYGVAMTHDMFSFARARLQATNEIQQAGIARTSIEGGFDYDGWTELLASGNINDPRVKYPLNSRRPWVNPEPARSSCIGDFMSFFPSIQPIFHLSNTPGECFLMSSFPPISYETWLPPHHRSIYILGNSQQDKR